MTKKKSSTAKVHSKPRRKPQSKTLAAARLSAPLPPPEPPLIQRLLAWIHKIIRS